MSRISSRCSSRWGGLFLATVSVFGLATAVAAQETPKGEVRPTHLFNMNNDPGLKLMPPFKAAGPAPPGSKPPNPDLHDLNGVWEVDHYEYLLGPEPGVPPPLKPKYVDVLEQRMRAYNAGTPIADSETKCESHGMPRLMQSPYPIEIIQEPGQITLEHEVDHELRRIYMNQRHPKNPPLSYVGDSVGHWEGDDLVVDTVAINDKAWTDDMGSSHSTQEHIIERIRKINGGAQLEDFITVIDPVTLEHPYSYTVHYNWRPDIRLREYFCEENNRNAPVNGVTVAR